MVTNSAALLLYDIDEDGQSIHVFIAHMGGPFWVHKDEGGWSIPKGLFDPEGEDPRAAACREFAEEIGVPSPSKLLEELEGERLEDLGVYRQSSGKRVHAFAARDVGRQTKFRESNTFDMEWPRGSGVVHSFPEVDRAQWFPVEEARRKLVKGQRPILETLIEHVNRKVPEVCEGKGASDTKVEVSH